MAKPVTHLSRIIRTGRARQYADRTITTTLCNRMTQAEINCSEKMEEVTCKFCLKIIADRGL